MRETTFDLRFEHRGLEKGAYGVNFFNEKLESFVYMNPEELWEGDFDEFVGSLIKHTLLEFICSKCQKPYDGCCGDNPIIEEGKIMASKPLCSGKSPLDFFLGDFCPCEGVAEKLLEGFKNA